jgi:fructokinase
METTTHRIGVDLGGTKIEAIALDKAGQLAWRERVATPKTSAADIYDAIAALVLRGDKAVGASCSVGIGTPGSLSPKTGLLRGSNTVVLNGQPVRQEIEVRLAREIRIANDANCFALSEAVDGAGKGAQSVFGVIFGTGCGGGVVVDGKIQNGLHAIAGEWGHNPLPWPTDDELPPQTNHEPPPQVDASAAPASRGAHRCYCGKWSCIETWLSGTGITKHFLDGSVATKDIVTRAASGDAIAEDYLQRVEDRMARALATVVNLLDPEIIVLGGGVSNIDRIYANVPPLLSKYVFSEFVETKVLKNVHGDSSGVRGAAWLW